MQRQDDRSVSLGHQSRSRLDLFKDSRSSLLSFSDSPRSNLESLKRLDLVVLVLVFVLLLTFSIHNFDSIGQDIGRHLKIGEIIWQTKTVPQTNLFSFTEPNFPFINHHWLSEVIFYKLYGWFGFIGLILAKVFLILSAFLLLFSIVKKRAKFWPLLISFLFSIFIFISRTEVRPEIFSFVILSFFLFVLFREKYSPHQGRTFLKIQGSTLIWFLPIAELFWVNLHIYFFIGPFLLAAFLLDRLLGNGVSKWRKECTRSDLVQVRGSTLDLQKGRTSANWKILLILVLTGLATLINPAGIYGALAPFNILEQYGYRIVENQTLSFLAPFFGFNLFIFVFKISAAVLISAFVLTIKKSKQRIFEIIISIFFIYAGFRMLRNLPLYALASFPVLSVLLTDIGHQGSTFLKSQSKGLYSDGRTLKARLNLGALSRVFKTLTAAFLIFFIFFVVSNSFYERLNLSRAFGFSVPDGLGRATNFVKENKIKGPMFNNFDIGGYLIWRFYPEQKVFVDNRPEAYSVKFFTEVYKPMQEDKAKWAEFSEKYGLNFIFFAHTDATPWGQAFLKNIVKDPDWKTVYLNESAIILVKKNQANSEIISHGTITEDNAVEKAAGDNLVLSRFFYNINWRQASLHFADEAIRTNPADRHAHLNKGLVHAYYTDAANQKLAATHIKKAIDLGLKDAQYYTILGIVYMNLGELAEAKDSFAKALERDKNNLQAKEFLNKFF